MRDIGLSLRIKYRLETVPTEAEAAKWAELVQQLVREGHSLEAAGYLAADRLFVINPNLVLKAEADTIESLLEQARKK